MRIVDLSHWGFLLEHEGMPFFVPLMKKGPFTMQHKVSLSDDFVIVINSGDLPFFIDNSRECHFFTKESSYGKLVMECMVAHVMRNER